MLLPSDESRVANRQIGDVSRAEHDISALCFNLARHFFEFLQPPGDEHEFRTLAGKFDRQRAADAARRAREQDPTTADLTSRHSSLRHIFHAIGR